MGDGAREAKATTRPLIGAALLASVAGPCQAEVAGAPCWIDKGALVAPAAFGDIAGDFIIDLSARSSALHVTRARADGVEEDLATRDLVLGGRRLGRVRLPVVDLDSRTASFETAINGVIGADLLRRFIVEIDPAPCRLRLLLRPPARQPGSVRLTLRDMAGRPSAPARISDGVRFRDGWFAIDTADWGARLNNVRLSRSPPPGDASSLRLRGVELAGRLLEQVPVLAATQDPVGQEDALGMAVWSRWRLRLDARDGWLELAPSAARP